MKTACLINNYNYADFVHEAVDSALGQSVAFDEIVVVDDGSTDGSRELLARRYGRNPRVKIVTKRNEGQLSCFNEGLARSAAEVLFFLDADDVFEPNYLEQALDVYQRDAGIDFVFCGHRLFGQREGVELCFNEDRDLGYSVVLTAFLRPGIGAPTSCLSMRRTTLEKFLPLPFLQEWRMRADDCLVFGASLAGAKVFLRNLWCATASTIGIIFSAARRTFAKTFGIGWRSTSYSSISNTSSTITCSAWVICTDSSS